MLRATQLASEPERTAFILRSVAPELAVLRRALLVSESSPRLF